MTILVIALEFVLSVGATFYLIENTICYFGKPKSNRFFLVFFCAMNIVIGVAALAFLAFLMSLDASTALASCLFGSGVGLVLVRIWNNICNRAFKPLSQLT